MGGWTLERCLATPNGSWVPYLSQKQLSLQVEGTLQAGTREGLKGNQCRLVPEWGCWGL